MKTSGREFPELHENGLADITYAVHRRRANQQEEFG